MTTDAAAGASCECVNGEKQHSVATTKKIGVLMASKSNAGLLDRQGGEFYRTFVEFVVRRATAGDLPLRFQLQLIQFQKFLNDGVRIFFHLLIGAEEDRFRFVQKDHALR